MVGRSSRSRAPSRVWSARARQYAQSRLTLERAGRPIGERDLLIASIALARGLIVVSHNVSEFARVPGLKTEDWV